MNLSTGNLREKRQSRRRDLHAQALVRKEGTGFEFSGEVTNVSDMGAHLATNCPLCKDDQLDLTIYFQKGLRKITMSVPCKVARIDGRGVGLASPHIDADMLLRLDLIFDVNKQDPKQLIEDFYKVI